MSGRAARPAITRLAPRGTAILGGGPAGTALLLAASRSLHLAGLLQAGLTVIDRGARLGAGALGGYAITSDSTADTFLTAIHDHPHPAMRLLSRRAEAQAIAGHSGRSGVPLAQVGAYLDLLGDELSHLVRGGGGDVLTGHEALCSTSSHNGWVTRLRRIHDGACFDLPSARLVIATGGEQTGARVQDVTISGSRLGALCGSRLMGADQVLSGTGVADLAARLGTVAAPRIVIVGGSTSAISAANLILSSAIGQRLGAAGLTVLHRRKLRPFYPSREAALADGFTDFGPEDICPVSGFVYRLAGFRTEARELVLASLGIGGRSADARLRLHELNPGEDRAALAALDGADCVIAAIGYRPRGHDLRAADGAPIALASDQGGAMVDAQCRVLDDRGRPLPGVFGLGLAAGFLPSGALGGEPSFRGQANGLWLWQNDVGGRIAEQLCRHATRPRVRPRRAAPAACPPHFAVAQTRADDRAAGQGARAA